MIKINLAPDEELANPFWWVPEVIVSILIAGIAFGVVNYNFGKVRLQIELQRSQADLTAQKIHELDADVAAATEIKKNKAALEKKREALQSITQSKIRRYRPIIVLEHLQNLRPDGLWFDTVTVDWFATKTAPSTPAPVPAATPAPAAGAATPPATAATSKKDDRLESTAPVEQVVVTGKAFDNILVAEFMTALKSTEMQEASISDLRTQVALANVELDSTEAIVGSGPSQVKPDAVFNSDLGANGLMSTFPTEKIIKFKLTMFVKVHELKPDNNSLTVSFMDKNPNQQSNEKHRQ